MKLSEIFDQLRYGELNQLFLGTSSDEGIEPENYPELITHINLALTALHTRFPLLEQELAVRQYDHISFYKLVSANSVTLPEAERAAFPYIMDTADNPFKDNILAVERVYDELGDEYALNDNSVDNAVYTPAYNTIQVVYPVHTNTMFVIYRGNHDMIPSDITDPKVVEVSLPPVLVPALLAYVASRVHSSRASAEATQTGIVYLQKYEKICSEVEEKNSLNTASQSTNTKLRKLGWV